MSVLRGAVIGLAAGAAGTTALNGVTYLDMAVRGRATSSAPQDVVDKLTHKAGLDIPGDQDTRANRLAGLGPLAGILTGLGVGAALGAATTRYRPPTLVTGVLTGAVAMATTDAPMGLLGVSDPRTWAVQDWVADAVPHLAYGLVTAAVIAGLDRGAG